MPVFVAVEAEDPMWALQVKPPVFAPPPSPTAGQGNGWWKKFKRWVGELFDGDGGAAANCSAGECDLACYDRIMSDCGSIFNVARTDCVRNSDGTCSCTGVTCGGIVVEDPDFGDR
jgi:hypothetical protein